TQENPRFSISEIELKAKGTSYTIETIRALKKIYPTEHFKLYFLMGADNINQLYLWKQPEELIQLCTCVA
ncbi:MAG: nicotinic acid mononucleotide adenylyltransferase, partial [Aliifodinibius sp.]|nr:nicotinic acid mononucleotide adenylyltransferase [Fodinibius sp.]NIV10774.1 nicotinic acid mononucleotide adenylyltransferase [Fodinibius sp.]NIY24380.1 nicotinic acid mononucleotide adenylyltransferase [Fodinibius sp.]